MLRKKLPRLWKIAFSVNFDLIKKISASTFLCYQNSAWLVGWRFPVVLPTILREYFFGQHPVAKPKHAWKRLKEYQMDCNGNLYPAICCVLSQKANLSLKKKSQLGFLGGKVIQGQWNIWWLWQIMGLHWERRFVSCNRNTWNHNLSLF